MISGAMCDKSVLAAITFLNSKTKSRYSMYRDEIFISKNNMAPMEACWKVERCVLCSSWTLKISVCLPDFRSFMYRLVCSSNAYIQYTLHNSTQLHMFSTQHNPLQELCTSPTNMAADQLQPFRDQCLVDTKIPGQQWWRCLQIKPASPQKFLEVRTKGNHKEQSWGCMQDVQGFPSPSPAANSWCHDSDEVSHYLKENDDTILQQVWSFERRTGHTLSCNTTAQYVSLTEVSGGTAWCNTSS